MRALARLTPLACLLGGGCIHQPVTPAVPQGWHVRVYVTTTAGADTVMLQGVVVWAVEDSLRLHGEEALIQVTVPVRRIARLEVFRGQRATAASAAKGAAAGAGIGALLGTIFSATGAAIGGAIFGVDAAVDDALTEGFVRGATEGAAWGLMAGATLGEGVWQVIAYHDLREEMCHCRLPPTVADPERP